MSKLQILQKRLDKEEKEEEKERLLVQKKREIQEARKEKEANLDSQLEQSGQEKDEEGVTQSIVKKVKNLSLIHI